MDNSDNKDFLGVAVDFYLRSQNFSENYKLLDTSVFNGKFVKYISLCPFKLDSQMTWLVDWIILSNSIKN